jgi:hypothetical protein
MSELKKNFRKITTGNKLASRIAVVPFTWIPMVVPLYLIEKDAHLLMNFFIFAVIYITGTVLLYFLFKYLVINKQFRSSNGAFLFFMVLFAQNIIMIFLYGYHIFTSKESLFITILSSLIIILLCILTMMRVSDNKMRIYS